MLDQTFLDKSGDQDTSEKEGENPCQAVMVPVTVWRCSGLCRALQRNFPTLDCKTEAIPASVPLHPDITQWCSLCGLTDDTLAHELYVVDGPVQWMEYLMTAHLEQRHAVSAAATRLLQQWWLKDTTSCTGSWATHWVTIMHCADYWQIDSLYWRMLAIVHRRYDELSVDAVEALIGVRPGAVPHPGR